MYTNLLTSVYDANKQFYTPKEKHDTQKRTASVYKSATKINNKNPLYITNNSKESKDSVVNIKKNATELYYVLNKFDSTSLFDKKIAQSSNEDALEVSFLEGTEDNKEFDIEIQNLARGQVNIGSFLKNKRAPFSDATHSVNIDVDDARYELQFYTHKGETNIDIQNRISRLINVSNIGIKSSVIHDSRGYSALKISSDETGLSNKTETGKRFEIYDKDGNIAGYFGLNKVNKMPENAQIIINGTEQNSRSNKFIINKTYEVQLKKEGESARISTVNDADAFTRNTLQMFNGLNNFLNNINNSTKEEGKKAINNEINKIFAHNDVLFTMGIEKEHNAINIDLDTLKEKLKDEDNGKQIKKFSEELNEKLRNIAVDPVKYMDKKVAAYKNPNSKSSDVYTISSYSGMLLNIQC